MTTQIAEIAPRVLERRRQKVRQRSKKFDRLSPRKRHELRIATKKLRYTTELFGSVFRQDDLHRFVSKLKRLQDALGYANDVRVAHDFLTELFAQRDLPSPAIHAWVGMLEWHDNIFARRERKLLARLDELNSARPFWR